MKLAWKEIKKNKARFIILGAIVFLVSLLTFMISGLADGLSQDNAALIKDMPEGHFYMDEDAEETYNLSKIDQNTQEKVLADHPDAAAFSIQMGSLDDTNDKQRSVAFLTSTDSEWFEDVDKGDIVLDESLKEEGIKKGDKLTNHFDDELTVTGFVEQKKFSHSPVAYIHPDDFKAMYHTDQMQLLFIPGKDQETAIDGLQAFSNKEFLNTIPSYSAEQMSLDMIVWFLIIISGMLFGIFFYMMNVQKIGLYGILKAIGVKTTALFQMMWSQMLLITVVALVFSAGISQLFALVAPTGMPFHLTIATTAQLAAVFVIIGLIGATLSGWQIKKVEALQAIQQGEV